MTVIILILIFVIIGKFAMNEDNKRRYEQLKELEKKEDVIISNITKLYEHTKLSLIEDIDVKLQKDEDCFIKIESDWLEYRKTRTSITYGHAKYRINFGHGFSYTIGNLRPLNPTTDTLTEISTGIFYYTNKRIFFNSDVGSNKSIKWTKIMKIDFSYFSDYAQMVIIKDTGKDIYIPLDINNAVSIDILTQTQGIPTSRTFVRN